MAISQSRYLTCQDDQWAFSWVILFLFFGQVGESGRSHQMFFCTIFTSCRKNGNWATLKLQQLISFFFWLQIFPFILQSRSWDKSLPLSRWMGSLVVSNQSITLQYAFWKRDSESALQPRHFAFGLKRCRISSGSRHQIQNIQTQLREPHDTVIWQNFDSDQQINLFVTVVNPEIFSGKGSTCTMCGEHLIFTVSDALALWGFHGNF